jgi:TPR repeat protein
MNKAIGILDSDYRVWVESLGKRFRQSQIKAAVSVNSEMLRFYWELGRDIVEMHAEQRWGDKLMRNLSKDLCNTIPDATGLTVRNIYYCKRFYSLYNQLFEIVPQVGAKLDDSDARQIVPQVVAQLFSIPLGHHRYIMDKCGNDAQKAMFYVRQTLENGWSRAVLLNWMDSSLYERQGKTLTNFKTTMPDANSDLAQEITKDPYNFAFAGILNHADTLAEYFLNQKRYDKALYWLIIDLSNYDGIFRTHREYYIMGLQYEYGVDVERDIKTAKQWYEKATYAEEAQVALERLKTKKNKRK